MRKLAIFAVLSTLYLAALSCSHVEHAESPPAVTDRAGDEEAIRKLVSTDYDNALNASDLEAILRLYASDAVVLAPEGAIAVGEQAVRQLHETAFKREAFQGTTTVDKVETFGDRGLAWGTWRGIATPNDGGTPSKRSGKFLVVVERQADGSWKISREIWNLESPAAE